jgi:hypothetical protein
MILLEPAYKILHTTVKFKRRTISVKPTFQELRLFAATLAANLSTQRTCSAVSGTCKPRASERRLNASWEENPSTQSTAARSGDERPIEALQCTPTLRPA